MGSVHEPAYPPLGTKSSEGAMGAAFARPVSSRPHNMEPRHAVSASTPHEITRASQHSAEEHWSGDDSSAEEHELGQSAPSKRKRPLSVSCETCKARKVKCDRGAPSTSPILGQHHSTTYQPLTCLSRLRVVFEEQCSMCMCIVRHRVKSKLTICPLRPIFRGRNQDSALATAVS